MRPRDSNRSRRRGFVSGQFEFPALADRLVKLTDLVAFREVWVEVVFSIPFGRWRNGAVQGESRPDRQSNRFTIEHGKCPRVTQAYGASLGIGRGAKSG